MNDGSENTRTIREIVRVEAKACNTFIHFSDGYVERIGNGIDEMEKEFKDWGFWRIHPSHLINPFFFRDAKEVTSQCIVMKDGTELPVSKELAEYQLRRILKTKTLWSRVKKRINDLLRN